MPSANAHACAKCYDSLSSHDGEPDDILPLMKLKDVRGFHEVFDAWLARLHSSSSGAALPQSATPSDAEPSSTALSSSREPSSQPVSMPSRVEQSDTVTISPATPPVALTPPISTSVTSVPPPSSAVSQKDPVQPHSPAAPEVPSSAVAMERSEDLPAQEPSKTDKTLPPSPSREQVADNVHTGGAGGHPAPPEAESHISDSPVEQTSDQPSESHVVVTEPVNCEIRDQGDEHVPIRGESPLSELDEVSVRDTLNNSGSTVQAEKREHEGTVDDDTMVYVPHLCSTIHTY